MNDLFIRVDKGMEIASLISFKIFVGMLFGTSPLLFFKSLMRVDISLGVVGEIKIVFVLGVLR